MVTYTPDFRAARPARTELPQHTAGPCYQRGPSQDTSNLASTHLLQQHATATEQQMGNNIHRPFILCFQLKLSTFPDFYHLLASPPTGHTTYATPPSECATFRPHHHQTAVAWPSTRRACRGLGRQTCTCTYCRRMTLSVWCSPDSCSTTHLKSISDYSIPPAPSGLRHYTQGQ